MIPAIMVKSNVKRERIARIPSLIFNEAMRKINPPEHLLACAPFVCPRINVISKSKPLMDKLIAKANLGLLLKGTPRTALIVISAPKTRCKAPSMSIAKEVSRGSMQICCHELGKANTPGSLHLKLGNWLMVIACMTTRDISFVKIAKPRTNGNTSAVCN
jgi:hypothetical protein